MSGFEFVSRSQEMEEILPVQDKVREFKQSTKQLAALMEKLPGMVTGEYETPELPFAGGDK